MMIGRLADPGGAAVPLAAVGYATQIFNFVHTTLFSVGLACVALMARSIGSGDALRARHALAGSLQVSVLITLVYSSALFVWSEEVLRGPRRRGGRRRRRGALSRADGDRRPDARLHADLRERLPRRPGHAHADVDRARRHGREARGQCGPDLRPVRRPAPRALGRGARDRDLPGDRPRALPRRAGAAAPGRADGDPLARSLRAQSDDGRGRPHRDPRRARAHRPESRAALVLRRPLALVRNPRRRDLHRRRLAAVLLVDSGDGVRPGLLDPRRPDPRRGRPRGGDERSDAAPSPSPSTRRSRSPCCSPGCGIRSGPSSPTMPP